MDKLSQKGNPSYPLLIGSKSSQSDKSAANMVTNILKCAIVSKGEMLPETRFLNLNLFEFMPVCLNLYLSRYT